MKMIRILRITATLMIAAFSLKASANKSAVTSNDTLQVDNKSFAVLELFTSEGCSSCPPADELIAKIQKESNGKDVYLLAYHVDYWDRQGWKDIFSNADYTKRQVQYGNYFKSSQIYTPQLVINGKSEFIGSDELAIRRAIAGQLALIPAAKLEITPYKEAAVLKIHYKAINASKASRLLIAFVQKNAQSKVERGENAGQILSHVQIVRKIQNVELTPASDGSVVIVPPTEFNSNDWEIIGIIQDRISGEILGATKAALDGSLSVKI